MAKVTSKLQVTLPKAIADQYAIKPGDEIDWIPAGDVIRVVPPRRRTRESGVKERLRLVDAAIRRQKARDAVRKISPDSGGRGWTREDLYDRRGPR